VGKMNKTFLGLCAAFAALGTAPAHSAAVAEEAAVITCDTPGQAAQCGEYEQCHDDYGTMLDVRDVARRIGMPVPMPAVVASCFALLHENLIEQDCMSDNERPCRIWLTGEISDSMASRFESFVRNFIPPSKRKGFSVLLDSNGGDVAAAMKIGSILREFEVLSGVRPNESCASACVLVLAGASMRLMFGPVIIHRPYRREAIVLGPKEAQQEYESRNASIRGYLQRMNVSPSLLDAMNTIDPSDSRTLTRDELTSYGLLVADPVYAEQYVAKRTNEQGITVPEYLAKQRRYDECTKQTPHNINSCLKLLD
jgi:hypothetical protein